MPHLRLSKVILVHLVVRKPGGDHRPCAEQYLRRYCT